MITGEGSRLAGLATGTGSSVVDQKLVFVWEKADLALTQLAKLKVRLGL